jgi:hypothetical protein
MIIENPVVARYDNGEFGFVREQSNHPVHPAEAATKGFFVDPRAARFILNELHKAGVPLLAEIKEVNPMNPSTIAEQDKSRGAS